jgi:chromosome segregation ATPase
MGNRIRELENEVDEMQDSFEVSALKDKNSMYQGDIKRLQAENADLKSDLAAHEAQQPDDATYNLLLASYERRISDLEGQLETCITENKRGIQEYAELEEKLNQLSRKA